MTTPVLTRYLYVKDQVQNNMLWAILNQEEDVAMFWGYELYFSVLPRKSHDNCCDVELMVS